MSVAAYVTVRQQMYRNLDDSLIQRASQAAQKGVLTNLATSCRRFRPMRSA